MKRPFSWWYRLSMKRHMQVVMSGASVSNLVIAWRIWHLDHFMSIEFGLLGLAAGGVFVAVTASKPRGYKGLPR